MVSLHTNSKSNNKRKKFHDKDKYYNLAKEQGLRSRAAFKLSQINRHYGLLDHARVVLDLCAAPGGWTQIAARSTDQHAQIIAVDIVPIRGFPRNLSVTTVVGDITTDKCKADIQRAIMGATVTTTTSSKKGQGVVDVVLHDGAPHVGASYDKDAYQQVELSLHALKCATQHLKKGGTFVTKIYRSRDSPSYLWVLQQLFQTVTTFKPKASRQQSAEIYYIAQQYYQPDKLDPRLLDPKHVFELVEGDTTQASTASAITVSSKFNVFHKSWDKAHQRNRVGYDTDHFDATMRHIQPLQQFVFHTKTNMDAVTCLSTCTAFSFRCDQCRDDGLTNPNNNSNKTTTTCCPCSFLLHHPLTSQEIKECVVDLKVLNKGDFKGLMTWREKMIASWNEHHQQQQPKKRDDDDDDQTRDTDIPHDDESKASHDTNVEDKLDDDEDEDAIQKEIQTLRERKQRERKKAKKKERKLASKKRKQSALGMDLNAIEVQEHDQFFTLSTLQSSHDLDQVAEVNLDQVTDEQAFGKADDDDDDDNSDDDNDTGKKLPDKDEETGYSYRMERDLDFAYERYLETTKNGEAKIGTKAAKRSKKLLREKLAQESHEDHELLLSNKMGLDYDTKAYAQLLHGTKDSDDEGEDSSDEEEADSDNESDGYNNEEEPVTPEEHHAKKKLKLLTGMGKTTSNPLIHKLPEEPTSAKTARWFSNPLFAEIGQVVNDATAVIASKEDVANAPNGNDCEDDEDSESHASESEEEQGSTRNGRRTKRSNNNKKEGMDAGDVLALMPKTDKQKRHEKRVKAMERDERRQKRKAKKLGEADSSFDLVPGRAMDDEENEDDELMRMEGMSEEKKKKLIEARKLIKAGIGSTASKEPTNNNHGFEVVEGDRPLPVKDERKYDSDHEDYDSDDYAKTMALGTMMLRCSKAKALVDASYNRYAWNDPEELPEWFVDDENRHYRPQLPIPPALLAKMKEKMAALSTKPIAKVAEARARKNRRAKHKLAAAKKKAQAVANSTDMTETMKLKSISKALRSDEGKKGGKQYIVSKKGQGKHGVKGAIMVDRRLKSDKRSMERASKKKKTGRKGGLTGSKRRRHHK